VCTGKKCDYSIQGVPGEMSQIRVGVRYVKVYRCNPKHLCPNLNGYADNGQGILKFDSCYTINDYQIHIKTGRNMWFL